MRRKQSDMKQFYKRLEIDFKYLQPETKQEMEIQMKGYGYHVKKGDKEMPSPKQSEIAWKYIQDNLVQKQRTLDTYYVSEKYREHYVYRATTEVIISGKKYRKGQFLPKVKA